MTTAAFGLRKLGQISMRAKDVPRATEFYRDALGIPFLFEVPGLAFFDVGGVRLMLGVAERAEHDHPGSILYFEVPDISAAHRELTARGVSFERPPHLIAKLPDHDLWMAFFQDSEGNQLALMSEVRER